ASMTILIGAAIAVLVLAIIFGAIFLKYGIQAGDGDDDSSFGSRFGSTLIVMLVGWILPPIGTLIAIKILGNRHDMNFGKSVLCFLVWGFLLYLVLVVLLIVVLLLVFGSMLLPLLF
ncbi:MAG: hypothetical protein ACTSYU_11415, partial [Promethearchaeota archaeon]